MRHAGVSVREEILASQELFLSLISFAPTSLAEATVEVKAAAVPETGTGTKVSATPKTGDLSPLAMGGIAIVGMLAAGGIALSLARRRR